MSDSNGVITKITVYETVTGKEQTYSDNDLTFKFSGDLDLLSSVKVNDVELDTNNYTKTKGSTIITLKKNYLDTLTAGTYTLSVAYTDGGSASTTFTTPEVKAETLEEPNPDTYDDIISSIYIGVISIIGLLGTTMYLKNKKILN